MKVLITGASGFLGGHLTRRLIDLGLDVRILARKTSDLTDLKGCKYEITEGDINNVDALKKATESVDSVFHLAGLVAYTKAERAAMEKVNVDGTQNVIDACIQNKIRRLVHMSSVVAVGASFDGKQPLTEASPYNISHLDLGYFETKHKAELLVTEATKAGKINSVILNPGTIYGSEDAKKGSRRTQIKVAQGKFPFFPPGGVNVIYVNDVIEATIKAWNVAPPGERYILGGENLTIRQVFDIIAECAGVRKPYIPLSYKMIHAIGQLGDKGEKLGIHLPLNSETAWTSTLFHWFNSSKAQRELGLRPTSAAFAIKESVDWIKNQL